MKNVTDSAPQCDVLSFVLYNTDMNENQNNVLRISVAGAAGRMGVRLCALAIERDGIELIEAFEQPRHTAIGKTVADSDVVITEKFEARGDVLIDFTTPTATKANIKSCVDTGMAMIIGTTGLTDNDERLIDKAAKSIPIVQAPNFSLVVNVMTILAAQSAKLLGDEYDIEILEKHHRFKKDAPSGTALGMARAICDSTGRNYNNDVIFTRRGDDVPRRKGEITMQSIRLGDTIGEHTVYFGTLGERMEIRHVGTNRDSYASGAIQAAIWLKNKSADRYTMQDVLGLDR